MIERIHRDFYVNVFRLGKLNILLRSLCDKIEHSRYLWATNFNSAVLTEKNCKHRIYLSNVSAVLRLGIALFLSNWRNLRFSTIKFLLMPCPFTGRKMICAGPNFLCWTKNLFTYCASHKHFVPNKKMICIQ